MLAKNVDREVCSQLFFLVRDMPDAGPLRPCATQGTGTPAAGYSQWCYSVVPCAYIELESTS